MMPSPERFSRVIAWATEASKAFNAAEDDKARLKLTIATWEEAISYFASSPEARAAGLISWVSVRKLYSTPAAAQSHRSLIIRRRHPGRLVRRVNSSKLSSHGHSSYWSDRAGVPKELLASWPKRHERPE